MKRIEVTDDVGHESVDMVVDLSSSGQGVTCALDRAALFRGCPLPVGKDNGRELQRQVSRRATEQVLGSELESGRGGGDHLAHALQGSQAAKQSGTLTTNSPQMQDLEVG